MVSLRKQEKPSLPNEDNFVISLKIDKNKSEKQV